MSAYPQLLERARAGDAEALQAVLEPHLPGLTAFVRLRAGALLRKKESCSDLVQSVCCDAIARIGPQRSDNEAAFKGWLYKIALHKILDKHDRHTAQKRSAKMEQPLFDSRVGDAELLHCYAVFCTPSRDAIAREELQRIEQAFEKLPGDYREVLVLARIVGLSYGDLAGELGKSEVAVRKLLSRARARLAMLLAGSTT
jgi:RNA polymerase sigma-70 factor (ECF subfamily)